jgi:Tfp pilus assembly protein PilO
MGLSLAAMLVGFYLFVYRPDTQQLNDLRLSIENKRRDVSSNQTKVRILPDVLLAVNEMRTRLEKFDKKLPRQPELGQFMGDITAISHETSLRRVFVEPGVPVRNGELFAEWPISLKFEGDFLNVFSFLRKTEQMQRLTRVRGIRLKALDQGAKSGQVQVELSMNIYFSEG